MVEALTFLLGALGAYYLAANAGYAVLLVASVLRIRSRTRELKQLPAAIERIRANPPGITVALPARNEGPVILESVLSWLSVDYPRLELIVVINDSSDDTLEQLRKAMDLREEKPPRRSLISQAKVLGSFRSRKDPRLLVLEQEEGSKPLAANTALDFASYELFCLTDADTYPERDSLLRAAVAFTESPDVVGVGGTLRIANGGKVRDHHVSRGLFPSSFLARMQIIEYIRSFYCGRAGWDQLGVTPLLPGAFGVLRRDALLETGGYDPLTVTEDLEVILRMRRLRAASGKKTLFRLLPEPVLWTLAPESWGDLRRQRVRWQRGLLESLWPNRSCFMNPRYGWYGVTVFPNFVIFEALEPWIQALTYPAVLAGLVTGVLDPVQVGLVLAAGLLFSVVVTGVGAWLEESHYSRHHTRKSLVRLLLLGTVENLGYRQINWFWRLEGCLHAVLGTRRIWSGHDRKGQAGSLVRKKDQRPGRRAG